MCLLAYIRKDMSTVMPILLPHETDSCSTVLIYSPNSNCYMYVWNSPHNRETIAVEDIELETTDIIFSCFIFLSYIIQLIELLKSRTNIKI